MFDEGTVPDRAQLQQFLLGLLDDEGQKRVEQWLLQSPESVALVGALNVRDSLVDTLRNLLGQADTPHSPPVADLVRRLEQLRPPEATHDTAGRDPGDPQGTGPPTAGA